MTFLIEVEDLSVRFPNGIVALEDINVKIRHPVFLVIAGPNGAGKTTFLKVMLGLIKPFKGRLKVLDIDPTREGSKIRKLIGYVPQRKSIDYSLPVKVKDIVLMGRLLKKSPPRVVSKKDVEAAKRALEKVGLKDLWDRSFFELSGGQQQRVLVARAISTEGKILILDEPFSGADVKSQTTILQTLKSLRDSGEISIVMVTHDVNPCHPYIDEVLLLNRRLIGYGKPCDLMKKEILWKVYGPSIQVIEHEGHFYAITGDSHA